MNKHVFFYLLAIGLSGTISFQAGEHVGLLQGSIQSNTECKESPKGITKDIDIVSTNPDSTADDQLTYRYGVNQLDKQNFGMVMNLAMHGNYQAQRNVAFGFTQQPYDGQVMNPVLGCAWYLVVLNSGSKHLDTSDHSNATTFCGKLDDEALDAAKYQAKTFISKINDNTKIGKLDN